MDAFKNWATSVGQVSTPIGTYLGECVSLVQQYLDRVHKIPFQARGHAQDWATNGNVLANFDRVSSPQKGDIGISGPTPTNPYGHIWIYLSPTQILEQNGRVARKVSVGPAYSKPLAILRKKGTTEDMQPITPVELNNLLGALWGVQTNPYADDYNSVDRANDHKNLVGKPFYEVYNTIYQDPRTFEYADKVYKALHNEPSESFEEVGTVLGTKVYKKKG